MLSQADAGSPAHALCFASHSTDALIFDKGKSGRESPLSVHGNGATPASDGMCCRCRRPSAQDMSEPAEEMVPLREADRHDRMVSRALVLLLGRGYIFGVRLFMRQELTFLLLTT
ncbi:hypothetical protein [Herbaspirillum sp. ST 5-3]|uniref:hypothetical protein n=1 Tax=Oxalobacteraceae TaxID=75682 RepID=UPI001B3BC471|nr:hypothetical protein [Herbaspirillum sp. ST 5-3]